MNGEVEVAKETVVRGGGGVGVLCGEVNAVERGANLFFQDVVGVQPELELVANAAVSCVKVGFLQCSK